MPNNTKISDLELATQLNEADLLLISQQESESEEFNSKKTTVGNLAEKVATEVQFSGLQTEDKTIQGAINEATAVGKVSKEYTSDFLESSYWAGSPCWIDSGETVDEHTVYKSDAGTYGVQAGDSLCSFLVEGYDDVTVYVKQDNTDTNRSYMLLGYANEPVSRQNCAKRYQGETLTNYVYHQYTYLQGKPSKIEALYHVDPPTVPGSVTIDLQDGQWVSTGETIGGSTVYKSHGGSYHIDNGSSKCVIEISGVSSFSIFCKPSSESGYDKTYIGKLDTTVSKDDSSTYINSFSGDGYEYTEVNYEINDENRHTIEILYAKDGSGNSYDDCGYIYFVKKGTPNESRGYIYIVPGTPHTPSGEVFNDYTNNRALGEYSHAEGSSSRAFGIGSHAEGNDTRTGGNYSHAEGSGTLTSYDYAHAEGYDTKATAHAAHAEGNGTLAAGSNTHAEGDETQALYNYAHAEGQSTIARAQASHAEGGFATANGSYSHAEGYTTTASEQASHAEGYKTIASNTKSHAEGYETTAGGEASHAEGYQSKALGYYSHAEGYDNIANDQGAHAEGSRNIASKLDSHAEGESTKAIGVGAHSEGGYTTASGKYSHAEGSNLNYNTEGPIASGVAAHAEGLLTKAEGMGSHAEGMPAIKYQQYNSTKTYNTGDIVYYFAGSDSTTVLNLSKAKVDNIQGISPTDEGAWQYWDSYSTSDLSSCFYSANGRYSSSAIGMGAHAEGILTIAWGDGSHTEGIYDTENSSHVFAAAPGSHAEGQGSQAYAPGAHAEGTNTRAYSPSSHSEGIDTQATSSGSHAEGIGTSAVTTYQHVQGTYNITDATQAFIIGNGYKTEGIITRSNAMTVDWNGNMVLSGDITPGTSLNTTATTIGGAINEIVARIPAPPTVDGTYTLSVTISNGVPTYSWV